MAVRHLFCELCETVPQFQSDLKTDNLRTKTNIKYACMMSIFSDLI